MLKKLFKDRANATEIAKFLAKSGEESAAKKIMSELFKEDPKDKCTRSAYVTIFGPNSRKHDTTKEVEQKNEASKNKP
jgi:hypothetical protein